jgi:hypothetical protein
MASNVPARRPARKPVRPRAPEKAAGTFSYMGGTYRLDSKMGVWPLLQFARAAESGWRNDDSRGLAAIHAFLQDVMLPEDWGRFQEDMILKKMADIEGLLTVVRKAVDDSLTAMAKASANGSNGTGSRDSEEPEED